VNDDPIVYIVDDDIGIRKSLQYLLESASLRVSVHDSGGRFFDDFDPLRPSCLVLDLRMPSMSGIEVLQRLRVEHHEIPAIMISGDSDVPSAINIMKLGAIDLLQKPFEPLVLLEVVRAAMGRSVEMHQRRLEREKWGMLLADLTPREREMLALIVSGRSSKQIATDLNIAYKTVTNHRANLMAKMHAVNAADLARMTAIGSSL
jgi:two-component system response regulator FixJ